MDIEKQIILKDYDEVNHLIANVIQNLERLKNELNDNKDNVKKLYEIVDKLESLQMDLNSIKDFIMTQIYLNSEYNED